MKRNLVPPVTRIPDPEIVCLRQNFRGLHGILLRFDAVTPKHAVSVESEAGRMLDGSSLLSLENVSTSTYFSMSMPVPMAVRATWREGAYHFQGKAQGSWTGGTIVGDYTVPVAQRIPHEILEYIRTHGGTLRVKIRLKDDGVLIGWDVEEKSPLRYSLPGGDFREAQFHDGKVVDPGWQE